MFLSCLMRHDAMMLLSMVAEKVREKQTDKMEKNGTFKFVGRLNLKLGMKSLKDMMT